MRIIKISASQQEQKVTVTTSTKETIILQKFGKDIVSMQNIPKGMSKECRVYQAIKNNCLSSDYFNVIKPNYSFADRAEITNKLKIFIGKELKTI